MDKGKLMMLRGIFFENMSVDPCFIIKEDKRTNENARRLKHQARGACEARKPQQLRLRVLGHMLP